MSKLVIFSDIFYPTLPYLEIPMYKEAVKRGIDTLYVLQENDIRLTDSELARTFKSLNLKTIKKPKHLAGLVDKDDLLLMRFAPKLAGLDAASAVRTLGRDVLMYDPSGVDLRFRPVPVRYLTAKSEFMKQRVEKKYPNRYFKIFVTGTIHCDSAATTEVDRDEFMISYGLDPNKKLVMVTPANPGEMGWQQGVSKEYGDIVKIVQDKCPNYEIVVKSHPMDYTPHMKSQPGIIHKNNHYGNKHSWEVFAPGIVPIKAEQGYMALKACDAVLNVRSSLAMETSLFKKPIININRHKYETNWPHDPSVMIDIKMGQLADTLNHDKYTHITDAAYNAYNKKYVFSDDGKAYVRTIDAAEEIMGGMK